MQEAYGDISFRKQEHIQPQQQGYDQTQQQHQQTYKHPGASPDSPPSTRADIVFQEERGKQILLLWEATVCPWSPAIPHQAECKFSIERHYQ